jgi:pyruvate kinase
MTVKTSIIATLGPASSTEEIFSKMLPYIDMVRLNFSWGAHEEMEKVINIVRKVSSEAGKKIFIIQDLSGPRIQTGEKHHFNKETQIVITNKDLEDIAFGIKHEVDFIALSFVGEANDIKQLRKHLENSGSSIPVIAKIERREAVENIEEIIDVSDAIMIARGDLGEAYPIEEIPFLEHKIISLCNKKNRFVIVATEMLLSMVKNDRPTRAEVTDVAYAVTDGADAVMLSEETASGDHPAAVVEVLDRIVKYAKKHSSL